MDTKTPEEKLSKKQQKENRQKKLMSIIKNNNEHSLQNFANKLNDVGIKASKATVLRDLSEMKYEKTKDGKYKSIDSDEDPLEKHFSFLNSYITKFTYPVNSIAIRTKPGIARAVEISLKKVFGKSIFGTLAGDNMVILILNSESDHDSICNKLKELTGLDLS